ncbi:hypothetical protein COW81_02060 [Candidatus Campbellbacteria bacterium CG22_combo_CG10-13_8_21_14_all_36_13]|uniref:Uncharacterized protein n=1 Tax=Candidatus Campbellbacteria bacterium CG22_combo_CG10-13_8_21_14_all_36_13 TaxID=1974529 RepID=A0A2H0DY49_9BACT|nr:MAG: hypothetical protein COW81_02060 [Candidatus Campbellbacteria bacterium CG22_combo_CG10-13_8_21_14_all_36_13]
MKILSNVVFKWWQVSILKISLLAFGIVIGVRWYDYFEKNIIEILAIFVVTAIYISIIWWKQVSSS